LVTRFYFRSTANGLSNLPTDEQSSLSPTLTADAVTVNRTLDEAIGGGQAGLVINSNAVTSLQNMYYSRFVSDTLDMASLPAQTWTYNFATTQTSTSGNFPVSGANKAVRVNCYVWRPSNQTKIGTVLDGDTALIYDEIAANVERVGHGTFSGAAVNSMSNGDVLVFEVWFRVTQATAASYTFTWHYNGTTANTAKNANASNHASFVESPQTFTFYVPPTDMDTTATTTYPNKFITKV
jgi:hypothetical protein